MDNEELTNEIPPKKINYALFAALAALITTALKAYYLFSELEAYTPVMVAFQTVEIAAMLLMAAALLVPKKPLFLFGAAAVENAVILTYWIILWWIWYGYTGFWDVLNIVGLLWTAAMTATAAIPALKKFHDPVTKFYYVAAILSAVYGLLSNVTYALSYIAFGVTWLLIGMMYRQKLGTEAEAQNGNEIPEDADGGSDE